MILVVIFLVLPQVTHASSISETMSELMASIVNGLGKLCVMIIDAVVYIASYDSFVISAPVIYGWVIIRDICNMFFILILLIIALATILRRDSYNYKSLLPKVLILALLINFSKTICGFAVDIAQIVMLTFVNGFKDMGPGNLMKMAGVDRMLSFSSTAVQVKSESGSSATADISDSTFAIYFYAVLYLLTLLAVLLVMAVILIFRIVILWFLIVISPIFFLLLSFPHGESYAKEWSNEFVKALIVGPVLAFFIWLSMASMGYMVSAAGDGGDALSVDSTSDSTIEATLSAGDGASGTPGFFTNFCVATIMLIAGVIQAQQIGGAGGAAAFRAVGKAKALGLKTAKAGIGLTKSAVGVGWQATKIGAGAAALYGYSKTGYDLSQFTPSKLKERASEALEGARERLEGRGAKERDRRAAQNLSEGKSRIEAWKDPAGTFARQIATNGFWSGTKGAVKDIFVAKRSAAKIQKDIDDANDQKKQYQDVSNKRNDINNVQSQREAVRSQLADIDEKIKSGALSADKALEAKKQKMDLILRNGDLEKEETKLKAEEASLLSGLNINKEIDVMEQQLDGLEKGYGISANNDRRAKQAQDAVKTKAEAEARGDSAAAAAAQTFLDKISDYEETKKTVDSRAALLGQRGVLGNISSLNQKTNSLSKEAATIKTPSEYTRARREAVQKSVENLPDDLNDVDVIKQAVADAIGDHDGSALEILLNKAMQNGQMDDVLMNQGFSADDQGLKALRDKYMTVSKDQGGMGMKSAEANRIIGELERLAWTKDHDHYAAGVVNEAGYYRDRTKEEQMAIRTQKSEKGMGKSVNFWRQSNGSELGHSRADGSFEADTAGYAIVAKNFKTLAQAVIAGTASSQMMGKLKSMVDGIQSLVRQGVIDHKDSSRVVEIIRESRVPASGQKSVIKLSREFNDSIEKALNKGRK